MKIASTALVLPNVTLGKNITIEDYCIIGTGGDAPVVIGDNSIIRSHTVIYEGNTIGNNFTSGNKANIRENNTIGDWVSIGTLSVIEYSTQIGNGVRIHSQAFVSEFTKLEDNCWIGPNTVLTNSKYPNSENAKSCLEGVVIKKGAIVGANTTVMPGCVIGQNTLIGAGSLVVKNTEGNSVYYGTPVVKKKNISEIKDYG